MAAEGISYTQAARLADLETGRAPSRVIDCHDLNRRTGVAIEDDDLITNGVWKRASDYDLRGMRPCEHYDYKAIEGSWHDASSAWLASRGAAWAWSVPGSGGTLTVPAGKDDEWADDLWIEAYERFGTWIDGVMSELRAGLQTAPDDDVRPGDAPGGEWVRYVSPRFGDD
jgi:hypothetical protein